MDAEPETVTLLSGASTSLSFAETITSPVLVVSPAAIVNSVATDNVKSPATAGDTSAADTVIVVAALDGCDSVAVTVASFDRLPSSPRVEPPSSRVSADSSSVTVGAASSSVIVNVALDGAATPRPPEAVPETVTDLSGESTEFPFAVTVTVPVLVVSPAAIVNSSALDNVKSSATAPAPAAAETVTVTASLEAPESVAVTVAAPPLSETDESDSPNATVGSVSSSSSVNVASDGAATPLPPDIAAAETVTDLSGESTEFPFAVTVTVPELVVSPAAIVNVVVLDSVKSAAIAPAPAAASTVTVTASLDSPESVAVTVDTPPLSETDVGDNASAAVGSVSSSVSVNVASDGLAAPSPPETVAETVTDLSGESTALPIAVIVTVPLLVVSPAAIVNVFALDNAKSPDTAGDTAAADTVIVVASLAVLSSVAVTVVTPPFSEIDESDSPSVTTGLSSSITVTVTPVARPDSVSATFPGP